MSKAIAVKRLAKEYKDVKKNPDNLIEVRFLDDNMMTIYYLLTGSPDTPYAGGSYFGCIKVKDNYPFSPPSIIMITPNGRFLENTRICLSMSDFHPESWNPAWTATRTIPMALLSFMNSEERASGCVSTSEEARRAYARKSMDWNCQNLIFKKVFGDKVKEHEEQKRNGGNNSGKNGSENAGIGGFSGTGKDVLDCEVKPREETQETGSSSETGSSLENKEQDFQQDGEVDFEDSIRIQESAKAGRDSRESSSSAVLVAGLVVVLVAAFFVKKI